MRPTGPSGGATTTKRRPAPLARRARAAGRRFVLVAPPEGPVGRILRLTLLLEHLDVVPDLGAARA